MTSDRSRSRVIVVHVQFQRSVLTGVCSNVQEPRHVVQEVERGIVGRTGVAVVGCVSERPDQIQVHRACLLKP